MTPEEQRAWTRGYRAGLDDGHKVVLPLLIALGISAVKLLGRLAAF